VKNSLGLAHPGQALVALGLLTLSFVPATFGQTRPAPSVRPAPVTVRPFRGKYCSAFGPQGWAVVAENAQRVAFGADFSSSDGRVIAGYSIFGGGSLTHLRGAETPDRAVAHNLTRGGTLPTRFGTKSQIGPNVFLLEFQSAVTHGVAFWQVIPAGSGGFMIVLRTAGTAATPGLWQTRGAEAMAVARSLRCHVPNVPPAPDPPGLNRTGSNRPKANSSGSSGGEGDPDTLYNQWLDKEYYHNSQTGENFWVSPSHDWVKDGPEGPGYYAPHGNTIVKLDPGYSQ